MLRPALITYLLPLIINLIVAANVVASSTNPIVENVENLIWHWESVTPAHITAFNEVIAYAEHDEFIANKQDVIIETRALLTNAYNLLTRDGFDVCDPQHIAELKLALSRFLDSYDAIFRDNVWPSAYTEHRLITINWPARLTLENIDDLTSRSQCTPTH